MALPVTDWRRASLVGALAGGVFWGLAAGAILFSSASAIAVAAICVAAVAVVIAGLVIYRRSIRPRDGAFGIGLVLAPLTGLTPVLVALVPGLVARAIFWKG